MKLITTSWDDGHALDFKLAELLMEYNLQGTFYIPQSNPERAVMSAGQMQMLAKNFEIGGHTISHTRLNTNNKTALQKEIKGSYDWLDNLLGYKPVSFCFPGGVYNKAAVNAVFKYGYSLARTTELFSTKCFTAGKVSATTLQVYPHSGITYAKHLIKRRKWTTLVSWLKNNSEKELNKLAHYHLNQMPETGGCFHLWGHSWEIEEQGLWSRLEELFKIIANRSDFTYIQNKGLIES